MKSRRLAALAAAVVAAVVLLVSDPVLGASASGAHEPRTPIQHFIVLMQEDHTFDNYFGTYPGADGIPAGTRMPLDPLLGKRPFALPFHLTDEPLLQMSHGKDAALAAWHEGRMDGFLAAQEDFRGRARQLPLGFYDFRDLPYYWKMAEDYVLFDRFFSSAMGGSYLNHVYWVAGGPGNVDEAVPDEGLDVLTIFDRLQRAGVSWKFYVQDYDPSVTYRTPLRLRHPDVASQTVRSPLLTIPRFLDDAALHERIVDLDQYYKDLRNGTLPEVAYIAPAGGSEHPPGSLTGGQRFVRGLLNSLMASDAWSSSAFLLTYDEWGGWYDHVRPPKRDANGNGFRVPALLVSPYARRGDVDSTELDFTSILRFIERNWNVRPLGRLDATAGSMMGAFDFDQAPKEPAIIPAGKAVTTGTPSSVRDVVLYVLYGAGTLVALVLFVVASRAGASSAAKGSDAP